MKNTILSFNRISYLLLFCLVSGLCFLSSCKDEEVGAPPVIERVRFTDPTTKDSSFTQATLGSTLAIVGRNLSSTQYVMLNNYRININPTYATDTHLIFSILDSVPTVATNPNVPNELKVVNQFGEATYQFQTLPPAPIVEQIGNQFARVGEPVTLYGKYFFFVDTVFFPGGVAVTEFTTAPNGSSLTVVVPEGFSPADGDIYVQSQSGLSQPSRTTRFYNGNKEGIISNFDDINPGGWGIPDANYTTTAPGIQPIDNKFALVNMNLPANGGWSNDKVINIADWNGKQVYPTEPANKYNPADPIANFDARMEVAVSNPTSLEGIELQIFYENENNVGLSANVPLKNFVRSTDGKWYTVSVPLANLIAENKSKLSKYGDILKANKDGHHHFRVVIENTNPAPVPITLAVDNVRIVNAVVQ